MPAIISSEHRFIAAIAVAFVGSVFVRLKCLVARTVRIRSPRVKLNGADDVSVHIADPLTLRHRIFVGPEDATLLHSHQVTAGIDIAALPHGVAVDLSDLSDDLSTQHTLLLR